MDNGCSAPTKTDNGIMRFGAQDNGIMRFGAQDNGIMRFGSQDNGIMKVPISHARTLLNRSRWELGNHTGSLGITLATRESR